MDVEYAVIEPRFQQLRTLAATQIPPPVATPNSPTLNDRTGA